MRHVFDGKQTEQVGHTLVTAGCSETSCAVLVIDSKTTTGTRQPRRDPYVLCTQLAPIVSRSNGDRFLSLPTSRLGEHNCYSDQVFELEPYHGTVKLWGTVQ